jgi:hypothetical protein
MRHVGLIGTNGETTEIESGPVALSASGRCRILATLGFKKISFIAALVAIVFVSSMGRAQMSTAKSHSLPHKDPTLATVFGVIFPGGGQLYTERWGKAMGIIGTAAVGTGIALDASFDTCGDKSSCHMSVIQTTGIVVAVLAWGYGWATAATDARLRNSQMLNTSLTPYLDGRNGRVLAGFSLTR